MDSKDKSHLFNSESGREAGKKSKRGQSIATLMEKYGNTKIQGDPDDRTYKEKIIMNLITQAANEGGLAFIKEYLDREEGKAQQKLQLSGDDQQPVIIRTEQQKKFIEGNSEDT